MAVAAVIAVAVMWWALGRMKERDEVVELRSAWAAARSVIAQRR